MKSLIEHFIFNKIIYCPIFPLLQTSRHSPLWQYYPIEKKETWITEQKMGRMRKICNQKVTNFA